MFCWLNVVRGIWRSWDVWISPFARRLLYGEKHWPITCRGQSSFKPIPPAPAKFRFFSFQRQRGFDSNNIAQLVPNCLLWDLYHSLLDVVTSRQLITMSSAATTRSVLRQSRLFFRQQYQRQSIRQASTTEQTAQKAKETAQQVKESTSSTVSKAQQGLSRVTSSAGPAISNAASSAGNALRKIGGRTGRLVNFVDCTKITHHSAYWKPRTNLWNFFF